MSTPSPPPGPQDPFGPVPQQQQPPQHQPPQQRPSTPYGTTGGYGSGYADPAYDPRRGGSGRRPATVTAAAWITIAMSVLTVLANAAALLALPRLVDYIREHRNEVELSSAQVDDLDAAQGVIAGTAVVFIVAALVACALAVLVLRRRAWARIALVVLSALCVIVGIVGFLAALIGGLWVLAAVAVIVLLFTGGANEWFRRTPAAWAPGAGGPQPW